MKSSRRIVASVALCILAIIMVYVAATIPSRSSNEMPAYEQAGPMAAVNLTLQHVAVERLSEDLLFVCDAELDNDSKSVLSVKSLHHSAFDGLSIVVVDELGRKLAQQFYTTHQSISSLDGRSFPLKQGKNTEELRFPIRGLPQGRREYTVLLVGTLPGSEYGGTLCSNMVKVRPR